MGRGLNYFLGSLISRQAFFAYNAGSAVTTAIMLVGLTAGWVTMEQRAFEEFPVFLEAYVRVLIPWWIGPVQPTDWLIFALNLFFGLFVLVVWTERFNKATGSRW